MKKELISNWLTTTAATIFFILMLINSFLVLTKTAVFPSDYQEALYYEKDNTILNILFLIMFSIVILFLAKYIKNKISIERFVLLIMIYAFLASMLFAILRRDFVQFDPFNVIDQASNFLRNNYSGLDKGNNYLYIYSHQITTVFLFQTIFSLFGKATFILYIVQSLAISAIIYMLYKIVDILIADIEVKYITVILSALSFPLIFYVAFIYGTLPGMFLVLLAIYNFIQYTKLKQWYLLVIVIFSLNIAILFIGNNIIYFLSILAVVIIMLIKKFDYKLVLFIFGMLTIMYASPQLIKSYYEIESGKVISPGVNKITWIAMGMQEGDREAGWWNKFNYDIMTEEDYNEEKVVEISKQSIKQRLNVFKENPEYALDFYQRKYENQFLDPTFQSLVITAPTKDVETGTILLNIKNTLVEEIYYGTTNKILFFIMKINQIFVYIFTTIFTIKAIRQKNPLLLIIPIAFIGGTLFHMIWEAKSRYIFPYFIFLIPFAAHGLVLTKSYIQNYVESYYKRIERGEKDE